MQSYPTLKVFGKNKRAPEDYQGGRDLDSLQEAAEQLYSASRPPPEARPCSVLGLDQLHQALCVVILQKLFHHSTLGTAAQAPTNHGRAYTCSRQQQPLLPAVKTHHSRTATAATAAMS